MATRTPSDQDVSNFLSDLIALGDLIHVDTGPDKYIRYNNNDDKVELDKDGKKYPLAIYGTRAIDCLIVNPFAEGNRNASGEQWFYLRTKNILVLQIIKIMKDMLEVGAAGKKKGKEDKSANREVLGMLGKYASEIDEKMIKEFNAITSDENNFFSIHYDATTKKTEVKCTIFISARQKAFTSVRVHSWEVFAGLLRNILGTDNLADFDYVSKSFGCPLFEGYVNVLLRLYRAIQPGVQMIDTAMAMKNQSLLVTLESHLKYFDEYYHQAKWCVSATNTNASQCSTPSQWLPTAFMPGCDGGTLGSFASFAPNMNMGNFGMVGNFAPMAAGFAPMGFNTNLAPMMIPQSMPTYGTMNQMIPQIPAYSYGADPLMMGMGIQQPNQAQNPITTDGANRNNPWCK